MRAGYLGLIILLITLVIMVVIFMITNPFLSQSQNAEDASEDLSIDTVTTPKQIDRTQDLVNQYQQKSIERQTIDFE